MRTVVVRIAVAVAAVVFGMSLAGSANAETAGVPTELAGVQFMNGLSGKCVAIPGGTTTVGTQAIQFNCTPNTASKRWWKTVVSTDAYGNQTFRMENEQTNLCLGVPGGTMAEGAPVGQYQCSPSNDQRWAWDRAERLRNVATGKCLSVPHGWMSDNVGLIQWTCGDSFAQRWF